MQIGMHMQNRQSHPGIRFLDLRFEDIVAAPEAVCRAVYAFCGYGLTRPALERILQWHHANPQNKMGVHRYALADFNFTEAMIAQSFGSYIDFIAALPRRAGPGF